MCIVCSLVFLFFMFCWLYYIEIVNKDESSFQTSRNMMFGKKVRKDQYSARSCDHYSAAALLAMQSAVLATAIPSVCLSVCHTLVLYPDE